MSGWRAAVAAVAVGALILTVGWLVGRSDSGGGGDGTATTEAAGDTPALACPLALDAACRAAGEALGAAVVRYEPGDPLPADAVVVAPSGDLPEGAGMEAQVVARTPVVIAVWRERALVLEAWCGTGIDTRCLAEAYGSDWASLGGDEAWGTFKLGLADPSRSQAGLAAWWMVAGSGVPDTLATSLRLRADDDGALLVEMAQFGDSRADAALATEAAVASQLENVQGRGGRLEVFYPDAGPWLDVVAAGEGRNARRLIDRLLESEAQTAFAGAGLRPATGASGALPDGLGVPGEEVEGPDEAAASALIDAWREL